MKVHVQSDDEPGIAVLDYAQAPGFRRRYPLLGVVVVAACVSVLFVVLVVPDFGPHHGEARVAITRSKICAGGPISTQLELYRMHMGTYPESLRELVKSPDLLILDSLVLALSLLLQLLQLQKELAGYMLQQSLLIILECSKQQLSR